VLVPVEDLLALAEQPNMPGTVDEHPNWRRRLPWPADTMLDEPQVAARIDILKANRK
jgi:4-alpha-glucanotransferase